MSSLVSGLARAVNSVPHREMRPIAEYEAWLRSHRATHPQGVTLSPSVYRRIAQLRRMHDTWAEIARCVGLLNSGSVKDAWLRLPEALR